MSTRVPITIEGNLVADPTFGQSDNGTKFAKFTVAVTDRKFEAGKWVDGDTQFHRTTAFGRTAENVKASLAKGDAVLVSGHLEFHHWTDESTGESRLATAVVADAVGPSLRYNRVEIPRRPRAEGLDVSATGPAVERSASAGASATVA